jgi:hypothetical protein
VACTPVTPSEKTPSDGGTTDASPDKTTKPQGLLIKRKFTYRIITGVSMGAGMASMIGLRNPDMFDVIGIMGGPCEHNYTFNFLQKTMLNGFCDIKTLEKLKDAGKLNTREAYCRAKNPKPRFPFEITADFNNWHYNNAGGNWNRSSLARVVQDLFLALGNPAFFNPKSTYWPHSDFPNDWRKTSDKERCKNPIVLKGIKHHRYNPDGKYNLISFCDGTSKDSGQFDPDRPQDHTVPIEVWLAVDLNGNGKRDYGEPVVIMPHELYSDVGIDGCTNDREDGSGGCVPEGQKGPGGDDPNGDDYNPVTNPTGTENNLRYDKGEPYKDYGIDGVPGTKDYGEDDKKFTVTPNWKNAMDHNPGTLVRRMPQEKLDRLNIYMDAGIRDLFNFHINTLFLYGDIKARYKDPKRVQLFDMFQSMMPKDAKDYDPRKIDWRDKGQHMYVRYGDPNADKDKIARGDGDHVHGGRIIDRILNFFYFVNSVLPKKDMSEVTPDRTKNEGIAQHFVYDSKALKMKHIYTVLLPPGFHANPDKQYPVLYLGHGYGMSGPDMASSLSLFSVAMSQGMLAKMIMVSLHGKCEQWLPVPGKKNEFTKKPYANCRRGTFYVNGRGFNNNGPQMEDAFKEIVKEVETRYKGRVKQPEVLEYRVPIPAKP